MSDVRRLASGAWLPGWTLVVLLIGSGCELTLSVDRSLANRRNDAGPTVADSGSDAAEPVLDAGRPYQGGEDAAVPPPEVTPCADSDLDGVCNLTDVCPTLSNANQRDSDRDGVGDACDACPNDPHKILPGMCGCAAVETDSDADGRADCVDACPQDPAKGAAGSCGCGVPDLDHDADGSFDCHESCPNDPTKQSAGVCGCGVADTDSDGDGVANCMDPCPLDKPDDGDADGVCDSQDLCTGDDASGDTDHDHICNDGDPCPADAALSDCSGACRNLQTDHDHCGACGSPCAFDETCTAGQCAFAGAALSFTLSWSEPTADLDLYVRTPANNVIYYANPSQDGGTKSSESAAGPGAERIAWPSSAASGVYEVCVVGFMLGVDTPFQVEVAKLGSVAQTVSGMVHVADANMSVAACGSGDGHNVLSFSN